MKMIRTIAALAVAAALCAGFASCSKDDDGDTPTGKNEVTLDGAKLDVPYAYYYVDDESTASQGMHTMVLDFYSYDVVRLYESNDLSKLPEKVSYVGIDFEVPESQTDLRSVTLAPGEYHIYVVRDMPFSGDDSGWQGESSELFTYTDSPLVIKKDGSKYTVTFKASIHGHNASIQEMTFDYTGPVTKAPTYLYD